MITTCARPTSVIALHFIEQPAELSAAEPGHGAFETLHPPRPEVEVDRADRGLNRAPQRPAVLPGQAQQLRAGNLVTQRAAVVLGDQRDQGVVAEVALGPDVPELEAGIVVARVLVVDQPELAAVVDAVPRET